MNVSREGTNFFPKLFRNIQVKKGQAYTLSFRIRNTTGSEPTTLGLAIAEGRGGWEPLGLHRTFEVGNEWKNIEYSFFASKDSETAQFQLTRFTKGTFEVDNLSLQSGAIKFFDSNQSLEEENIPIIGLNDFAPLKSREDFYQFIYDTEQSYWVGMYNYLKDELGVVSVISGTQLGYSPPFIQDELDYIDIHSYWCHPSVHENWRIRNVSMVNSMTTIKHLASQRVFGKPYTISEYNHPFPNQYGAEGQPMLRAYGALQGWDGVFEYTFHHRKEFDLNYNLYFFSINDRTDVLAHLPACAAIYLRGDVREANDSVVAPIMFDPYFEKLVSSRTISSNIASAGFDTNLSLIHKTGVTLNGEGISRSAEFDNPTGKILKSDTEELTWNREIADKGYFTVNTLNSKVFTGFPEGRTISLGEVDISIGDTRLGWATVSLVSQNANGFGTSGEPSNILLTATGLVENKGMKIQEFENNMITLSDWGKAPMYAEGIPMTVILPSDSENTKCYALNPKGKRKKEIPVESIDGKAKLVLKPSYKTIWYEIEIK